ncbi:hypothetical protein DAPPUDRAFT_269521 [Daphnia pulex]|uniref:Uncharacterized protein n=1 Tax=Daphnia pulex TaxID=6669 RepID=E9HZF6_DAPPU|nr:hypothetical protein DAPPUDRAFT_269521 [Daphnia pulex]|eukprot:EFX62874.1 hypothetical protein DAPPUDRAFT_269521 [Daphnia pulex]
MGGSEGDDDGAQDQACDNGDDGRDGAFHTTEESGDDETAAHVENRSAAPRMWCVAQALKLGSSEQEEGQSGFG